MATVTDHWFGGGGLEVSVTYNSANGAAASVSVTNTTAASITVNVAVTGKGTFTHTFPPSTTTWNVPNGFVWGTDTPTFTAWWE